MIVRKSTKLALVNILGTLHDHDAANIFFIGVLGTQDPSSSIGKSSFSSGPIRESDQTKVITITFNSEEVKDRVYRASFGKGHRVWRVVPTEHRDIEKELNSKAYWLRKLRPKTIPDWRFHGTKLALEVKYPRL